MEATYDQAKKVQLRARAVFGQVTSVRTVAIVRVTPNGFGLRIDVANDPPSGTELPNHIEGVPVELRVRDDAVEAQESPGVE